MHAPYWMAELIFALSCLRAYRADKVLWRSRVRFCTEQLRINRTA